LQPVTRANFDDAYFAGKGHVCFNVKLLIGSDW
jgi:hypothetical protein